MKKLYLILTMMMLLMVASVNAASVSVTLSDYPNNYWTPLDASPSTIGAMSYEPGYQEFGTNAGGPHYFFNLNGGGDCSGATEWVNGNLSQLSSFGLMGTTDFCFYYVNEYSEVSIYYIEITSSDSTSVTLFASDFITSLPECDETFTMPCQLSVENTPYYITQDVLDLNINVNVDFQNIFIEDTSLNVVGEITTNNDYTGIWIGDRTIPYPSTPENINGIDIDVKGTETFIPNILYQNVEVSGSVNVINPNNIEYLVQKRTNIVTDANIPLLQYTSYITSSGESTGFIDMNVDNDFSVTSSSQGAYWLYYPELEFSSYDFLVNGNVAVEDVDYSVDMISEQDGYFKIDTLTTGAWQLVIASNTAPVINSITPSSRVELTVGETQLYTADVTDDEGDASYSWTIGATEVSTDETYYADWSAIEPGIYTLTLEVSDAEYSDTASTTLEIRAKGGSSGGSSLSVISDPVTEPQYQVTADQADGGTSGFFSKIGNFFSSIGNWFAGLF